MRKGMKKCAVLLLAATMVFEAAPMTANAEEVSATTAAEAVMMAEKAAAREQKKSVKIVTEESIEVTVTETPIQVADVDSDVEVPDVVMGSIITGTTGPNRGISFSYNSTTKALTISGSDYGFCGGYIKDPITGETINDEPVSAFDNIATDIETIVVQNCTLSGPIYYMFANQKNLKSVTFSNVNTTHAIDMAGMFYGCESLVSLDLSGLNTANVEYMELMFAGCTNLTNLNVSTFNTANVIEMWSMFEECTKINNLNLTSFDTSNATDISSMFFACESLTSLNLKSFKTHNVKYFEFMFDGCASLQSLDISGFNTAKGENFVFMFAGCSGLKYLDLKHFNTANALYMSGMFAECTALESLNISSFNTAKTESMVYMFSNCSKLANLDLSNFNTANVIFINGMFSGCSSLESLKISNFKTQAVEDMGFMFADCMKLKTLDVSNFNTSNVISMDGMFSGCCALKDINLSSFDTSKVTSMDMFMWCCESLEKVDLSSFDLSALQEVSSFLSDCDNLNVVYTPKTIAAGKSLQLPGSFNVETGGMISEITRDNCNKVLMRNVPATRAIALSVPKAATKLTIDNNMQFTVTVAGEALPVAMHREYKWTVSDPNVLSVSDKGVVTGVGMGTATVTCTSKFNAAETASYQFTIEMPFTDIKATDWQYPYVLYAYQNNLMGGKGEGKFDMNGNITRGEFVTVLYSNASKPSVTYEACFTDVPQGQWFADAVIWAKQNNVTAGNPDGTFGVYNNITREQLVLMLYQYAKNNGIATEGVTEDLSSFADASKVSSWAAEAMKWGVQNSIIGGKNKADGTYLEPQGKTARGECATMMMRFVELAK